jgi:hypothetical protein
MKLEDFESFYGFEGTEGFDFILKIGEKEIKISELKDNIDEFLNIELNEYHIDLIFQSDRHGMQRFISYLTTNEVLIFLREKFDNYRQSNEPLNWIHNLAYMIRLNPQNFKTEHLTTIETWLIELEKNYNTDLFNDVVLAVNQTNEIDNSLLTKYNTEIFKDLESYRLFLFLVDEYAVNKSVTQFSQIYHWLKNNDCRIKNGKGTKYQSFVKTTFGIEDKFSRISELIHNENVTLNDIYKRFDSNK